MKSNTIKKFDIVYLFTGFLIILFAPIEIYLSSIEDTWFSLYDFVGYLLGAFAVFIIAYTVYEVFIAQKIKQINTIMSVLCFYISIALYIQGNFMKTDFGELNGKTIDWSKYRTEGVFSILLFAIAFVISLLTIYWVIRKKKYAKCRKTLNIISGCMIILMIYTISTLFVMNDGFQKKDKYVPVSEGRWDYSKNENFIILLVDNFDSRNLDELLAGEDGDETRQLLEDFTYFEDAKGFYEFTALAVPQILTGEKYLNQTLFNDYLDESYSKSPFLNRLVNDGYDLNIHTTTSIPQGDFVKNVDNWKYMNIGVSSHKRLLEYMYKLVGFRYLPQQLKQKCWFYSDDMDDLKTLSYISDNGEISESDGYYEWHNSYLHENMSEINTSVDDKVFHFTHIKGTHVLHDMGPDFNVIDCTQNEEVSEYDSAHMCVKLMNEYVKELKDEGIYHNSVIVILADHGEIAYKDYSTPAYELAPLLLIKGKGETHDLEINHDKVSYDDLQGVFISLLDGADAVEAFGKIDENRIRYVYIADYKKPARKGRERNLVEYAVPNSAKDSSSMYKTGNEYR